MKKSLIALAVLGAYAGAASAQSSVTLYGTLDVAGRYVKADGQSRKYSMYQDGINSSQLGVRGVEDLGGGMRAGFTIISSIGVDDGDIGSGVSTNKFWNRRSTVSLFGPFGEVRLGRDYTPSFWNQTIFDAFGTNGLGSSTNVRQMYGGTRQDNTIGYFLPPNIGGFYGQGMLGTSEGATSLDRPARYIGGRIGFAAGPFDIAFAAAQQKFATGFTLTSNGLQTTVAGATIAAGQTQKTYNIGGSWDFGWAKLLGYYDREDVPNFKEDMYSVSAVIPFGQSEVHVGYDRSKRNPPGADTTVDQIKATYQYNLSKRTAVYSSISRLDNKNATTLTLPGANGGATAGGQSTGVEFGVRHFF